jgi:mono/diheme cytochrome c family protein
MMLMEGSGHLKGRLQIVSSILLGGIVLMSLATAPPKSAAARQPVLVGAQVGPQVLAILQRSCQDCHSDMTHYPWYSYVAPVSWLIREDVTHGRQHLNLSRWGEYSIQRRERSLSEIANQVKDREMPLPQYTVIHRTARLSDAEVDAVFQWTQAERSRLISENSPGAR